MQFTVSGVDKIKIMLDKVKKDITAEVLDTLEAEIKKRTPIDTGRARRGWQQRGAKTLRNDVPYIERLEGGYSRQAPRGFTKQAIRAATNKVNRKHER